MAKATSDGAGAASGWARIWRALVNHPTSKPRINLTLWSALGVLCLIVIGAAASGGGSPHNSSAAHQPNGTSAQPTPDITTSSNTNVPTTAPRTSASVTPRLVDTTGGVTINGAGAVLPNPSRTPGATNPAVTQADIGSTICVSGWTATVRPPSSYTTALKERQLASGYAYNGDLNTADYEEDHLISLEIGGAPASESNLWPEPYNSPDGARVKDVVENKLHSLVCGGTLSLATAQHAIAANWWAAYLTYVGGPAPSTPTTTARPPATTTAPAAPLTCTASMTNATPRQYSSTDVIVHTASGASVVATAHYKTTNTTHSGTASPSGVADIAFSISRATVGYAVEVDVTVTRSGASNSCSTSFTPQ